MKNVQFFIICESDLSLYESCDWEESQALVLLFYSERLRQLLRTHSKELESESERLTDKEL